MAKELTQPPVAWEVRARRAANSAQTARWHARRADPYKAAKYAAIAEEEAEIAFAAIDTDSPTWAAMVAARNAAWRAQSEAANAEAALAEAWAEVCRAASKTKEEK